MIDSTETLVVFESICIDEVWITVAKSIEFFEVIGVVVVDDVLFELTVRIVYVFPDDELLSGVPDSPSLFELGFGEVGLVIAHNKIANKIR